MADVETVIQFLRKNGLKESESALKQDILINNHDLGSFDFEKFLFPVLPPVKIPTALSAFASSSTTSSDDEFVSLISSTTGSEFTNPYGLRSASGCNSEASSESLSQFGTARDYHDFDMHWRDERDEGNFLTPCFGESDFFGCPSEDKFVMSCDGNKQQFDDSLAAYDKSEGLQSEESFDFFDKPCLFNIDSLKDETCVTNFNKFYDSKKEKLKGCDPYGSSSLEFGSALDLITKKSSDYSPIRGSSIDWSDGFKTTVSVHNKVQENSFVSHGDTKYDVRNNEFKVDENSFVSNGDTEYDVRNNEFKVDADEEAVNDNDLLLFDNHEEEFEIFNLRIIHRKNRTGFEENKDLPVVLNTVIAGRYYITEYLGSAAFSKVFQAHDLHTGIDVCLKIIKNDKDFFDQSLDEIKLLKLVNKHDPGDERHILRLFDYFYHQEHLFIVCELLKANLYEFQKFNQESGGEPYFTLNRLQIITRQCLEGLEYLHHLGVIHCDLKPENILMKSYKKCEIKIIDLGSSCFEADNLCLYVQSRSYRAPEVILGLSYDQKIDLWSLGCILAELCSGEVLFPNDAVVMILTRMVGMLGPIDLDMLVNGQETFKYFTKEYDLYYLNEETNQIEYIIPEESSLEHKLGISDIVFIDFVRSLLEINPQRRPSAREALDHPWLSVEY